MSINNLYTIVYNNEIRCIVEKQNKSLCKKIAKTKMEQITKLGKRTIINTIIPYNELKTKLLVPRFMTHCLGYKCNMLYHPDVKSYVNCVTEPNTFDAELSQNKLIVMKRVTDQIDAIDGASLLLNTGKGKTTIGNFIINHYKQNSCIIVVNEELQIQAEQDAKRCFGDSVNIVLLGGKKTKIKQLCEAQKSDDAMKKYLGGKLTIFICVYMSAKKLTETFWKHIYLTVFDECHCYCNSTGIKLMETCRSQKILAMSATIEYDWRSKMAEYWCGPVVDGDAYVPDRRLEGKVTVINYKGKRMYTEEKRTSTGTRSNALMVNLLAEDPDRNKLIIDNIFALLADDYVVIVIASSNLLLEKLNDLIKCDANTGLLIGPTSREERQHIKRECNVIFTNYMFSRVGVNIPRATAMIFASPYKENGKQINGRILRSDEPKLRRYIDIVDANTYLKGQLKNRLIDYQARNFTIEYV